MKTYDHDTSTNQLPTSEKHEVAGQNVAGKRRGWPVVKAFFWVLCLGGLVTSLSYGQTAQPSGNSPDPSKAHLDVATRALTQQLRDPDASVRRAAVLAVRTMGLEAKAAIPMLAERLRDPDAYIRIDAAFTMQKMGKEAVTSLMSLVPDNDPKVRELAVQTLDEIGPEAKAAIPAITARLWDEDAGVRQAGINALRTMGLEAKASIPALALRLSDPDSYLRIDASHALEKMGPEAIPAIVGMFHDPDEQVRELAVRTVQRIEKEALSSPPQSRR